MDGAAQPDCCDQEQESMWSVVTFWAHTAGESGRGTVLKVDGCVTVKREESSSPGDGEVASVTVVEALDLVSSLERFGEGRVGGKTAAGAIREDCVRVTI